MYAFRVRRAPLEQARQVLKGTPVAKSSMWDLREQCYARSVGSCDTRGQEWCNSESAPVVHIIEHMETGAASQSHYTACQSPAAALQATSLSLTERCIEALSQLCTTCALLWTGRCSWCNTEVVTFVRTTSGASWGRSDPLATFAWVPACARALPACARARHTTCHHGNGTYREGLGIARPNYCN